MYKRQLASLLRHAGISARLAADLTWRALVIRRTRLYITTPVDRCALISLRLTANLPFSALIVRDTLRFHLAIFSAGPVPTAFLASRAITVHPAAIFHLALARLGHLLVGLAGALIESRTLLALDPIRIDPLVLDAAINACLKIEDRLGVLTNLSQAG